MVSDTLVMSNTFTWVANKLFLQTTYTYGIRIGIGDNDMK